MRKNRKVKSFGVEEPGIKLNKYFSQRKGGLIEGKQEWKDNIAPHDFLPVGKIQCLE